MADAPHSPRATHLPMVFKGSEHGHFQLNGKCLTTAYIPSLRTMVAGLVDHNTDSVSSFAKMFRASLGDQSQYCLKVIGPAPLVPQVRKALEQFQLTVEKVVEVVGMDQEAYVYADTGRVRVGTGSTPSSSVVPHASSVPNKRIRVLIVDDSKTIRGLLTQILSSDPEIEVVGAAAHPFEVEAMIQKLRPDLLTLDIHMPDMDGVSLLAKLFPKYRVPALMVTSVSMEESDLVFRALEIGAIDYVQKPSLNQLVHVSPVILEKVKAAATAKQQDVRKNSASVVGQFGDYSKIIAIGSSTGGTEALRILLTALPPKVPPILITQHIPPVFSTAFAKRMATLCPFEVKEAENGDEVRVNRVLIAPGDQHMKIESFGEKYRVVLDAGPPVNRHKPSVDVMFQSVAEVIGRRAIGIILTGMGADGAQGLLKMRQAKARTIGQDEASCVVYGMPREAAICGAVEIVRPLDLIAKTLVELTWAKVA